MLKTKIYIILLIYIISCVGVVINFHYCGGHLHSVALYHSDEDGCCGENGSNGCCDDKSLMIETDDSESLKSVAIQNYNFSGYITPAYSEPLISLYNKFMIEKSMIPPNHAPPDIFSMPLFIENHILLI